MKRIMICLALLTVMLPLPGFSAKAKKLEWKFQDITYSGVYLQGKKNMPGIVIYHQWMGLSDHEKGIARDLNQLGYTVLAADVYGVDNRPKDRSEAPSIAGTFYKDRQKFRDNATAALEAFLKESGLNSKDTYVIGYCFGGTTVLELGRSGVPLKGIVSLHGGLANPRPEDDARINAPILILHGAEDQAVSIDDVTALVASLRQVKKDFSLHIFAHAVHGFTHKHDAERYNKEADRQSWLIMLDFFQNH